MYEVTDPTFVEVMRDSGPWAAFFAIRSYVCETTGWRELVVPQFSGNPEDATPTDPWAVPSWNLPTQFLTVG